MICVHQINEMLEGDITTKVTVQTENNAQYMLELCYLELTWGE